MPLGHYLSVGKLEQGSALSESAERDKSLALMLGRSAQRLRLSTVSLSVRRQQMRLKDKKVKIQEEEGTGRLLS
jgi:hypothetical protein